MVLAPIYHIKLSDAGIAFINNSGVKVADIAIARTRWNHSPDEIRESYPALSLSQIHAALAHYYDHRDEIEAQIRAADSEYDITRTPNPLARPDFEARLKRG